MTIKSAPIAQTPDGYYRRVCHTNKLASSGFLTRDAMERNSDILRTDASASKRMAGRYAALFAENQTAHAQAENGGKLIKEGGLDAYMVGLIAESIRTAEEETTCEWLVAEGYASDMSHASELVASVKLKDDQN